MQKQLATLIAAVGILLPLSSAHAITTSGSACTVPYGAANPNTSGNPLVVECPLNAPPNGQVNSITMLAFDRNATFNVSCTLHAWDNFGNYITSRTISTTGGVPGAGIQRPGPLTQLGLTNVYHWSARCSIPAATVQNGTTWMSHIVGFDMW